MQRCTDFNFVVAAPPPPRLAWLLLLAGVAGGVVVADRHDALSGEHDRLTRQIARLERKLAPPAAKPRAPAPPSALAGRQETERFPWDIMLNELELAFDARKVALLNLDTDIATRRTRLDGEAREIEDALAFAARLRDLPIVRRVLLIAHETKKTPSGTVSGFSLQIDWDLD